MDALLSLFMNIPLCTLTHDHNGGLAKNRIESLCDCVFSIVMTLLILDIRIPQMPPEQAHALLPETLALLWPKIVSMVVSFIVLGVYWVGHHTQFHQIRRMNRTALWLNIFFMLTIAFIPFSASLIGQYPQEQIVVLVYGFNHMLAGSLIYAHWVYATRKHRLVDPDIPPLLVKAIKSRIALGLLVTLIAMGVSFVNPFISILLYIGIALFYLLPGRVDYYLHTRFARKESKVVPYKEISDSSGPEPVFMDRPMLQDAIQ